MSYKYFQHLLLVPTLSLGALFSTALSSENQDEDVLVTTKDTPVFKLDSNGNIQASSILPKGTVIDCSSTSQLQIFPEYWLIVPQFPSSIKNHQNISPCFLQCKDVFNLSEMQQRVRKIIPPPLDKPTSFPARKRLPKIIQLSDHRLADVWIDLSLAIEIDRKKPLNKRIPELYFSRSQIWAAAGNNADALANLLEAASIVRHQNLSGRIKYAEYFLQLQEALENQVHLPGRPTVGDPLKYWGIGVTYYRSGQYDKAVMEFTDAVQLAPESPLYWYSRALTYRALRMEQEAQHDVRIGAEIESSRKTRNSRFLQTEMYHRFEHFSGPDRIWLEQFRRGNGRAWKRY